MVKSALQCLQRNKFEPEEYIFPTDFEYVPFKKEEITSKCLEDRDVIYLRFIYLPDFRDKFKEKVHQETQLNKYFFLPTHKAKEFRNTINNNNFDGEFSEELKDYYTDEMIEEYSPKRFYSNLQKHKVDIEDRTERSTSLFVLFSEERFDDDGNPTLESILKKDDIEGLDSEQIKTLLLEGGLKVSELLSMQKFLISYGFIFENFGILEWDMTLWTTEPKPGSSHIHFYKLDKNMSNINFQNVADNFVLLDKEQVFKKPNKRRNSRRR